jgi:RHS repeat-associated protein
MVIGGITLVQTATGYDYQAADESTWRFNAAGLLKSRTLRNGWAMTYSHNAAGQLVQMTNQFGRSLLLAYNADGLLAQATTPDGGNVVYTYNSALRLSGVRYADNTAKTYLYENAQFPQALTGVLDENNARLTTYTYDTQGRATDTQHAAGANHYQVAYPATPADATRVTDPLGATRSYRYANALGQLSVISAEQPGSTGSPAASTQNSFGLTDSSTDLLGFVTNTTWDTARRLPTATTQAAGQSEAKTTGTQWHATMRLPVLVTEQGRTTAYTYDSIGNKLTETVTDTHPASPSYNQARTNAWAYTAQNLMASATDPLGKTTRYSYNSAGNVASITNPLGHVTTMGYDSAGRMASQTEPNGLASSYTYDPRGRVTSMLRGSNLPAAQQQATLYTYTPSGQLASVLMPNAHQVSYSYDAAQRLTGATDNRGNRISYTLDAMGNRVAEEVRDANNAIALATQRAISTLGRIDSITTGVPPSSITTRYGFDANGQAISNTDGLNQSTQASLDGLGRPSATTFADTSQARQAYNQLGQITQVTDPKGIATRYTQNAWGETLTETSPDSGTVAYTRDIAGNVTSKTDARGQTTRYSYDDLYRITSIVQADGKQQSFAYDGTAAGHQLGYLREVQDASGSTRYTRDPFGRITSKTQTVLPLPATAATAASPATAASTLVTRYSYTSAGQLAQISYPSGLAVTYKRNATGQISAIDTQEPGRNKVALPFVSALTYNALQLPTAWQWQHCTTKNGTPAASCTSAQRSYDSAARMGSNELASYGYDAASRITSLTQKLYSRPLNTSNSGSNSSSSNTLQQTPITWQIAYDSRGRVTRFERTHAQTSYSYDANSNRLSSSARSSGAIDLDDNFDQPDRALTIAQAYNVEASSNRLLGFSQTTSTSKGTRTLSTVSASVNYPLDAAGNITSDGLRSFGYDANNRHSQTTLAGSGISASDAPRINYLHNAFGQRVFKSEPQSPRLSRPDPATNSPGFAQWLRTNFPWMYDGEGEDEAGDDDKKDKDSSKNTSLLGHSYVYDDALGGANTLLGEYGNGGASSTGTTEYLWLPTDAGQTIPIGLYRHGKLYAVHSDHLDTPRLITDDSNQPVWQWPYSAFGDNLPTGVLKAKRVETEGSDSEREREGSRVTTTAIVTTATVQLKATDPAITLNLRFAGQYRDSETGLFYNYFRSYDPRTGSYTQSDPIGLQGGLNRYGYAGGNPLSFTDPLGLYTEVVVWDGVGIGSSSFGHVSTNVNGQNFSWGPGGWDTQSATAAEYNRRQQDFRGGTGVVLNLSPQQEAALASCMRASTDAYSAITNNCGNPVQQCLKAVGAGVGNSVLPSAFLEDLRASPNISGNVAYPSPRPGGGFGRGLIWR